MCVSDIFYVLCNVHLNAAIFSQIRVSLCNSTTAEEPCGLKCILDKICLSFIFNWVLAETNKLTLIISQQLWSL